MNIFDLAAKLSLDKTEYDKGLDEGESKAKNFGKAISTGLQSAAKIGAAAVGTLAGAVAGLGTKLTNNVKELASYGDEIDKNSQKMGISAEAYQEWSHVMDANGASIESMKGAFTKLAKAAESGSDAFEKVGISLEEIDTLTQEELFDRVIEGLQGMGEGSERTAAASELLGGAAKELGPLLNQTAEDTAALKQEAHDLGYVLSDETVKNSAAFSDALDRMSKAFEGLKNQTLEQFIGPFTEIVDGITKIATGDVNEGFEKIEKGVDDFVDKLADAIPKMMEIGGKILINLVDAIVKNAPKLIEQGVEVVGQLVSGLLSGESLRAIAKAALDIVTKFAESITPEGVEEFTTNVIQLVIDLAEILVRSDVLEHLVDAGIAIVTGLANALLSPDSIQQFVEKAPELIGNLVTQIIDSAFKMAEAAVALIDKLCDSFDDPDAWNKLLEGVGKLITQFSKAIVHLAFRFKELGEDIIGRIIDGAKAHFDDAKGFISDLVDNMGEAIFGEENWNKFKSWGKKVIDGFTTGLKEKFNEVKDTIMKIFDPFGWLQEGGWIADTWNSITGGISDAYTSVENWAMGKETTVSPFEGKAVTGRAEAPVTVNMYAKSQTPSELYLEWTSEAARRTYLEA